MLTSFSPPVAFLQPGKLVANNAKGQTNLMIIMIIKIIMTVIRMAMVIVVLTMMMMTIMMPMMMFFDGFSMVSFDGFLVSNHRSNYGMATIHHNGQMMIMLGLPTRAPYRGSTVSTVFYGFSMFFNYGI